MTHKNLEDLENSFLLMLQDHASVEKQLIQARSLPDNLPGVVASDFLESLFLSA